MIEHKPLKVAIASGKGGTGKTLVATNLAGWLSRYQDVLLVDLDVEEPDDHLFIKGTLVANVDHKRMIPVWDEADCTHCGLCHTICKYNAIIKLGSELAIFDKLCHSCYACSELCPAGALPMQSRKTGEVRRITAERLIFIEGQLDIGEEQAVPLIIQTQKIAGLDTVHIPIQFFDCPPGTSCPVIAAVKNMDFVILVAEPTPFGLHDLKLAVRTMRLLQKPFGVVINRDGIGNGDVESYCIDEQIALITKIPFDREIARCYSRGELVYNRVGPMSLSLSEIINFLTRRLAVR